MADAEARRCIGEDFGRTLFVEASAGTGKTRVLIERIVGLLAAGRAALQEIVAVTFTEKAAGEMKLRLRSAIENERAERPSALLDDAVAQLELARVGTIHAFCADLLRERPIEAGLDPLFGVCAEDESQRLLDRAFDVWFGGVLEEPPPGVRRILRRRARFVGGETPRAALRSAVGCIVDHRDFDAPWRRVEFARSAAIDEVLKALREVGDLTDRASWSEDYLARNTAEIQRFVEENQLREDVRGRDYDSLEAELRSLARVRSWRWKGSPRRPFGDGLPRPAVLQRRDEVKRQLDAMLESSEADLAPLLQAELRPVVAIYEDLKRREGKVDFLDLLLRARNLLRDHAQVRGDMQQRFTHYFVDEFQDTDPLQAEILLLLAADDPGESRWQEVAPVPGKLFFVGDPKQAIYRFRRADVQVYEGVKRQLLNCGGHLLHLRTSFRAVRPIQQLVNACFAPLMQGASDGSQADYVALEGQRLSSPEQPAVIALPVPRPYADYGKITNRAIEESFPEAVGAFVDWLVRESGWCVEENDNRVALQPRHVCILFRRFKQFRRDVTRDYVRSLEVRQIPHVLVGGRSFHEREEVLAIRNAVCAIEWPEDELRLFATLRGPFFAFGDDTLLSFRKRIGVLHPLRRYPPEELDSDDVEVTQALEILRELHFQRNRRPVADTISRLLAAVRVHAGVAIWPTGEQALANCMRMIDVARRFESGGARSFRAFVERLESDAEQGVAEEAPAVEEGTEGVRVMTVHRAKGLEFPVVILADPTCNLSRDSASRHVEPERSLWAERLCGCAPVDLLEAEEEEVARDRAEGIRVAYVAATRARDLLVVPAVGDPGCELDGWLSPLSDGLYPSDESRRSPRAALGCPPFGGDAVADRPQGSAYDVADAVAPGEHAPAAGEHGVIWWDPAILDLDREHDVGLRQQSILEADKSNVSAAGGARAHEAWQKNRAAALSEGSVAELSPQAVTVLAINGAVGVPAWPVEIVAVDANATDAALGASFGTLVHASLAAVDLGAATGDVRSVVSLHATVLGLASEYVDVATARIVKALMHPLLRAAASHAGTANLRREVPVAIGLDDETMAEGVIDLAFRDGDEGWVVVDFKTDAALEPRLAEYRLQLQLYCESVAAATGQSARGVLLRV